jgi:hypothetical protein
MAQVLDLVQSGSESAATVSVANIGSSGITTVADSIDLPSVQIPSVPLSSTGDGGTNICIEQTDATPPPAPARWQSQTTVFALIGAAVVVLGIGGYLLTGGEGETGTQTQQPGDVTVGTDLTGTTTPAGSGPIANTDSAGLPSIFSNEQTTASTEENSKSGESAMDVFNKHRDKELAKAPEPVAQNQPPPRRVITKPNRQKPRFDATDPRAWKPVVH